MRIVKVSDARPQLIKVDMISMEIVKYDNIDEIIIHTGNISEVICHIFFEEIGMLELDYNLGIQSIAHGAMTGRNRKGI